MMQNLEAESSTKTNVSVASTNSSHGCLTQTRTSNLEAEAHGGLTTPFAHITKLDRKLVVWLCPELFKVITIIPLLEDYTCPICTTIVWKPGISSGQNYGTNRLVRLSCSHVFCVSCMVRLQNTRHNGCPICRKHVVLQADSCSVPVFAC